MTALTYERELVQIIQTAEKLRHELALARAQLAALINIPPGLSFKLVDEIEQPDPVIGHLGLEDLFAEAVFNRPEIRELTYRLQINEAEAYAALLDILPKVGVTTASSFNDDHFLMYSDWVTLGSTVAGSVVKILQAPARRAAVEQDGEVLRAKALATTAAIMTQVLVSRIRQRNAAEQLETAREYRDVQERLVRLLVAERNSELIGEQTLIREEMNLLIADVQHDIALGTLQSAGASLMTSLGYDMQAVETVAHLDLNALTTAVRANWSRRSVVSERGRYLAELERARQEAERQRQEAERRRREEAKRAAEDAKRAAREAKLAAKAEAQARQVETERLKRDVDRARRDAQRARRGVPRKAAPALERPKPVWTWEWPWFEGQPVERRDAPHAGGKQVREKTYSGTK